ncbi:MAG: T9SS type A sorting domain-containing protein [Saprospiraceae bacterium]|nr:T9SS type A sorting domain-containing protein [Saprospiraceae bacterium]
MQPKTVAGFGVRKLRPSGYSSSILPGKAICLFLFLTFVSLDSALAQCQLACRGKVNVSLGDSCRAEIFPEMLLTGSPSDCPGAKFRVDVLDHYMKKLPSSPYATGDYMQKEIIGMVYDSVSKNACWSKLYIEDKFGPVIVCREDTIYCNDTMALSTPVFYDNCDPNPTITFLGEHIDHYNCDSHFIKKVYRYWQGRDNLGNLGKICTTMFWMKRIPIDSIEYPKNFVKANDCHLECNSGFLTDANGNPHPYVTGVPRVDSLSLWPSYLFYCNLSTNYEDMVVVDLPCKKKIIRLWKVVEWWCNTAVIRTHPQTIEILDTKAPHLHCPYDFTVTTSGGYQCEANVWMPEIEVQDDCQDSIFVDIDYPGGILKNSNGGYIKLKPGLNDVVYIARDNCYNADTCHVHIEVFDRTPPVAVCQQNTVVTLTRDDLVQIPAHVFDDGSYDDCHIDSFLVRRMDDGEPCNIRDTFFRPYVEFCCEDAGKEVMVIFRVVDKHGNVNDCMVNVEVQDKTPPVINCPHDYRITCSKHNDTIDLKHRFGVADYYDNCVVHMHEYVDSFLNQCGLGYIERVFVVRDNMNRYDSCRQRIDIYDYDPFDSTDIVWPLDFEINSCGAEVDPANLPVEYGYPRFADNECSLIGVSFEDHQFNYVQDTALCYKILRKWKVIDWCQCYYDSQSGQTVCPSWHHEQVIKVHNRLPPKIQDDCEPVRLCISDQECLKELVDLTHEAVDDCTPNDLLRSSFKIDLHNDGYFDSVYTQLGNRIRFHGELPIGHHRFLWIWEDQCGNPIVCTQFVDILNCKAPTAYCLSGISVNIMAVDTNGDGRLEKFIDIWAADVDKGSYQFCGNPVTLSFSRDTFDRYIRYGCDSLGMHRVALWVTDQLTGLQDHCFTTITIQDNNNICNTGNFTADVGGLLITPYDQPVGNVRMKLQSPAGTVIRDFNQGKFLFENLPVGDWYKISPVMDLEYLEGVTTLDIVKIQRHILGLESFDSPWHYLAADVTGDKRVTSADIAAIRKLVLGIDARYKNNLSWKFIEANYKFPVSDDPWYEPFSEEYTVSGLAGDMMYMDFRGVKVGDVSQTTWNGFHSIETRSKLVLECTKERISGENRVAIVAESDMNIRGMQFSLRFLKNGSSLNGLSGGVLPIGQEQLGWKYESNGYLLVSWNGESDVRINKGDVLFYLEYEQPLAAGDIDAIDINSDIISAELYNEHSEIVSWRIREGRDQTTKTFECGEPIPNPFSQETRLQFFLGKPMEIQYSITDMNGSVIYKNKENYRGGQNALTIQRSLLSGPGVYFLKLEAGEYTKSMKLVMIGN